MEKAIHLNNVQVNGKQDLFSRALPSLFAGQAAGLIMAVVIMIVFTVFLGTSPLYPVQVIGSVVFGGAALGGFHLGAVIAGLILHQLGASLLWGAVFAVLADKLKITTVKHSLIVGLGVGIVAMIGPYLLIPAAMKTLYGVDFWNQEVPIFWDWAAHLVFGASFAMYPLIKNKLNGSDSRVSN